MSNIPISPTQAELDGLNLRNPFLGASGCFGYGLEMEELCDLSAIGGFVTKSVTVQPREGNPMPRIWETPSGMINAIGLENCGLDCFVETKCPKLATLDTTVLVNVAGFNLKEYAEIVERLDAEDAVDGFEINISCPNVGAGCISIGTNPEQVLALMKEIRPRTDKHLMVKLTPNVTDIVSPALAAQDGGANSISLINTLRGMAIDVQHRTFRIANRSGGLSGPAVRPVALKLVYDVAQSVQIPVVGLGGIDSLDAALQFILAGASAVQIGTYGFVEPGILQRLAGEFSAYLQENEIGHYSELIGAVKD